MSKTGAERPGSPPRLSSGGERPSGRQLSLRTRAPVLCTGCEGPSLHPKPGGQREGASEAPNVQAASPSQAWPTLARLVPSVLLASPLPLVVPPPAPIRALQVIRVLREAKGRSVTESPDQQCDGYQSFTPWYEFDPMSSALPSGNSTGNLICHDGLKVSSSGKEVSEICNRKVPEATRASAGPWIHPQTQGVGLWPVRSPRWAEAGFTSGDKGHKAGGGA